MKNKLFYFVLVFWIILMIISNCYLKNNNGKEKVYLLESVPVNTIKIKGLYVDCENKKILHLGMRIELESSYEEKIYSSYIARLIYDGKIIEEIKRDNIKFLEFWKAFYIIHVFNEKIDFSKLRLEVEEKSEKKITTFSEYFYETFDSANGLKKIKVYKLKGSDLQFDGFLVVSKENNYLVIKNMDFSELNNVEAHDVHLEFIVENNLYTEIRIDNTIDLGRKLNEEDFIILERKEKPMIKNSNELKLRLIYKDKNDKKITKEFNIKKEKI